MDAIDRDEPRPSASKDIGPTNGPAAEFKQSKPLGLRGLASWLLTDEPFIFWTPPSKKADTRFVGKSGKDDNYKFSLPTGFGFPEDILKGAARRFVSDAKLDLGGPKCSSCNEM